MVFVLLVAVVYVFFSRKEKISTQNIEEKLFEADSSKIEKIEIIKTNESITLEKIGGNWMVTKPINYPADTNAVTPILSNLKNFKIESEYSSNPANYSNYLDSVNNTRVNVYQEGKQIGSFTLGKAALSADNSYIQTDTGKEILLASKLGANNFTKPLKDFRNKLIFSIQSFLINKITFKSDDSLKYEFTMEKDTSGRWFIGGDSIPQNNSEGFLNLMANFNTEDFKDTVITAFSSPAYTVTLIGQQTTEINFYKQNTSPLKYIVQVSNNKQLFEMSDGFAKMVMKTRKDFIPNL